MQHYTNVQSWGGRILYRGIENGRPILKKIDYHPTLYVSSKVPTQFTTIFGEYLGEVTPGNIRNCRDFVEKYKDVDNFKIYGNTSYEYNFIADEHPGEIEWDINQINIVPIDIEVDSRDGYAEAATAENEVISITMRVRKTVHVFGCQDWENTAKDSKFKYHKCRDELDLLAQFLSVWTNDYPDVITGWYCEVYDIPYLVNRITRIMGEDAAKRLSPWRYINERTVKQAMGAVQTYDILGISMLDYIALYKKYAPNGKSQDDYKLGNIAYVEVGTTKVNYEEEGTLNDLFVKNYQKFIDYNIQDVLLIDLLEDKLKLIFLALTLAYDSKTNYADSFSQVRMWHALVYNHLRSKNIVVPFGDPNTKTGTYKGGYVKEPILGKHRETVGFDLTSLYPSLIMMFNMSPETVIQVEDYSDEMRRLVSSMSIESFLTKSVDLTFLKDQKVTATPNGQFFTLAKKGFMPEMVEKMFADRQRYKDLMKAAKKELQLVEIELSNRGITGLTK